VIVSATGSKKTAPKTDTTTAGATGTPTPATGDQDTGFDLYVTPPGTYTWRLDGEVRTDRLPSKIRGVAAGTHAVVIDAPAGFMGQNTSVTVEAGKAGKVEVTLQPLDIAGAFESTPPGAKVYLIVDGKREPLGLAPAKSKLDPRKTYNVLFEMPGYVSVNRQIMFSGTTEEKVSVTLEKVGAATSTTPATTTTTPTTTTTTTVATTTTTPTEKKNPTTTTSTGPVTHPDRTNKTDVTKTDVKAATTTTTTPPPDTTPKQPDKTDTTKTGGDTNATPAAAGGTGTLLLGSKPPCEIYIDGKSTGLHTPQKDIKLPAGKHKVTLVNNEFGIKETFSVDIKADATEKQIKDYSDRLPK
jgi:hypothetical protein